MSCIQHTNRQFRIRPIINDKLEVKYTILDQETGPHVLSTLLLFLLLSDFPYGSVVYQPIVNKLFKHINDNILHQATITDFFLI